MRQPTLSQLAGDGGFAVKSAVPRESLPRLIPLLKQRGGTDIVISPLSQVVA
jgi:ATP phosphoribosyltransferase-like protein